VLADPLPQPLFRAGKPEHVDQLTASDPAVVVIRDLSAPLERPHESPLTV